MLRGVVAEFEHQNSTGLEKQCRLCDQRRVNLRARFAAEKRRVRLVVADFARQRRGFVEGDVGGIAGDEIEVR